VSRGRLAFLITALAFGAVMASRIASADEPTKRQCVVANETAQDLQRSGKLVEARQELMTCAASACPGAVRGDCADRLQAVGLALPTVVLTPKDASGGDASGAALAIDGVAQPAGLDGTPVAVDPGQHTFTATLAGRAPFSLRLVLKEGDRVRRDVIFRAALPTNHAPAPPGSETAGNVQTASRPDSDAAVVRTRRIAWSAIGAGVAGVALGTIFGFLALGKRASLGKECQGTSCPPSAEGDIEGLHVSAVASNVAFVVGVLGLGAGAVLLLTTSEGAKPAASRDRTAIVVRPWVGLGDVGLGGSFR